MFIQVTVVAGAKREKVEQLADDRYSISVREPAKQNLANDRIRRIMAERTGASLGSVRIVAGHRSHKKVVSIN